MDPISLTNIDRIFIKFEVDKQEILMITLTRNGTVNRMGDGSGDSDSLYFAMGRTEDSLLEEWMKNLNDEILSFAGRYEYPDPKGKICHLTIALEGEGVDTGFEFTYGEESDGPPEEIFQLVEAAVLLTDPWYEDQQSRKRQRKKR